MYQTGESGNNGEDLVRKWTEVKNSRKLVGVERESISAIVEIIKDEINLKDGADMFGETLEKMFNEATSSGTTTKLIGDLNDDTMLFAIFNCITTTSDDDKINIAYVINTLSTDLPRKNTRLTIRAVKDFNHRDLTQKMIDHLTKDSEAEMAQMTEGQRTSVPMQPEPVARDAEGGASSFCTSIMGPALATAAAAAVEGLVQGPMADEASENQEDFGDLGKDLVDLRKDFVNLKKDLVDLGDLRKDFGDLRMDYEDLKNDFAGLNRDFADLKKDFVNLKQDFVDLKKDCAAGLVPLAVANEASSEHVMMWTTKPSS